MPFRSPVRSAPTTCFLRSDRTWLSITHQHAQQAAAPVARHVRVPAHRPARVAHEQRVVALPGGLDAEVVVDAAVAERDVVAEAAAVRQVVARLGDPVGSPEVDPAGGQERGERRGGGDGEGQRERGVVDPADPVVREVGLPIRISTPDSGSWR